MIPDSERLLVAIVAWIGASGLFVQCICVEEITPHQLKGCDDVAWLDGKASVSDEDRGGIAEVAVMA